MRKGTGNILSPLPRKCYPNAGACQGPAFPMKLGRDNTLEVQEEKFMLKFRQTAWVLRFSNMLLNRAGLVPQTRLESFPRFQVIRQGFQGQQGSASIVPRDHLT